MAVGTLVGRFGPNHRAAHPLVGDACKFPNGSGDVLQGDQAERDQPLQIAAAVLARPIIEGAEARAAEFSIVESEQRHTHRRINDFSLHSVAILVFDAIGRVPHALRRRLETPLPELGEFVRWHTRGKKTRHGSGPDVLAYKELAFHSVEILDGAGRPVTEPLVDAFSPHARWFDEMRISRDETIVRHGPSSRVHDPLPSSALTLHGIDAAFPSPILVARVSQSVC